MSLFKAFQRDRKIGKTPFSLNYQNILTANFGGLTPIGKIQVLPNDTFKVGTNILTKVEPMPAPAFTRIKQNQYAFFVPNEQTWQHWNDYISNGTAYADTYGNNSTNQKLQNLWRIPQIPANQIQLIAKVANGWAIPVFDTFSSSLLRDIWSHVFSSVESLFTDEEIYFLANNLRYNSLQKGNLTVWFMVFFSALQKRLNFFPDWFFTDIPFWNMTYMGSQTDFPPFIEDTTRENYIVYIHGVLVNIRTEFGCDYYTGNCFYKFLNNIYTHVAYAKEIGRNKELEENVTFTTNADFVAIRSFCDNISNDVTEKKAPFILVKKVGYNSDGTSFHYYAYQRNLYEDETFDLNSTSTTISTYRVLNRNVRKCGYFWSSDIIRYEPTNEIDLSNFYYPVFLNNFPFNPCLTESETDPNMDLYRFLGVDSAADLLSDNLLLSMLNFKSTPNEILYDVSRSTVSQIPPFTAWSGFNAVTYGHLVHPFHWQMPQDGGSYDTIAYNSANMPSYMCYDILYPLFTDGRNDVKEYSCQIIPFSLEERNLGYDSWSFFIYCCKNNCKLLDYMNIPLEGLAARSYEFYAGEFIKALPFFAYSKIWNDYFRNKVTSSAEMDYCETNSVCSIDNTSLRFYSQLVSEETSDSKKFPDWFKDTCNGLNNECPNGWSIPFSCAPKNANEDLTLTTDGVSGNVDIISDVNHFHDFRIYNWFYSLSLLTGFQLMSSVIFQIIRVVSQTASVNRLMGILAEKFYLPSYYNGLLHYKYQNFNKDYFSSALLDPMSGANQENIGDTVNSLINAEAKQGFWNRLAQNRSVTQFWQSVFGVKPSHDDYDKPLLLGSAHTDVNVGEVVQLSQTDTTPQGQRSGLGSAHDSSKLFKHTFNEHGYILILVSHTLELQYMQGLEKDWTPEESFLDYPFIDFVGLGNQSINQKELNFTAKPKLLENTFSNSYLLSGQTVAYIPYFANPQSKVSYNFPSVPKFYNNVKTDRTVDFQLNLANGSGFDLNSVFGYIPRYSTFKFCFDQCHGEFRNQLAFWHSFRKFFTQPILCHEFVNWEFMSENDELQRMFFVTDDSTDKFKIDSFINITSIRPLPYVCTPKTSI